ncbi:hypothetical protein ADL21_00380 [Streptomyces albus subsp. albus]|nr:hypothetical protein ADL21_00380 [Streptomyces albus subsp. albus]
MPFAWRLLPRLQSATMPLPGRSSTAVTVTVAPRTVVLNGTAWRPLLGHEPFEDAGAVRQLVLEREVVDRLDGGRLVEKAEPVCGIVEPGIQPPGESRAPREGHQFAPEFLLRATSLSTWGNTVEGALCPHFFCLSSCAFLRAVLAAASRWRQRT